MPSESKKPHCNDERPPEQAPEDQLRPDPEEQEKDEFATTQPTLHEIAEQRAAAFRQKRKRNTERNG